MAALALERRQEILERVANGESVTSVAKDLGYSGHAGITERLGDDPEYIKAMRIGVIGKIERREQQLEEAPDNVSVTRADRLLGHARWWAESMDSERFGRKNGPGAVAVQVVIQSFDPKDINTVVAVQDKT